MIELTTPLVASYNAESGLAAIGWAILWFGCTTSNGVASCDNRDCATLRKHSDGFVMTTTNVPARRVSNRAFNNLRNGRRVVRLALGQLPGKLARVTRRVREYRVALESACEEVHGEITIQQAHWICTAATAEQHALVCLWLLRERFGTMSTSDVQAASRQIAQSRESRDRAVSLLELGIRPDAWGVIEGRVVSGNGDRDGDTDDNPVRDASEAPETALDGGEDD